MTSVLTNSAVLISCMDLYYKKEIFLHGCPPLPLGILYCNNQIKDEGYSLMPQDNNDNCFREIYMPTAWPDGRIWRSIYLQKNKLLPYQGA